MKRKLFFFLLILLFFFLPFAYIFLTPAVSQDSPPKSSEISSKAADKNEGQKTPDEPLSVTHHSIQLNGKTLKYIATAGYMPLKEDSGKLRARIFFVAYIKDEEKEPSQRPITFAFKDLNPWRRKKKS